MQPIPALPSATAPGPEFLAPSEFMDSQTPDVRGFAEATAGGAPDEAGKAVRLYYAVRDGIRYDPYSIRMERETYRASHVLHAPSAYCIPKAILLAAAARALGIAAGLGFADVKNHLTTRKLRDAMGTDVFIHHGYTVLYLGGRWVKCTPAFNIELCRKFGVLPLEFNGRNDSLMHPYDSRNQRHMEYLKDRGLFSEFPFERVMRDFRETYPAMMQMAIEGRFENEEPLRP